MENPPGKMEYTSGELRALQLKSLEILDYFKGFCKEHSLTFFLCGGCCIGALRHGGFIPWDDDVDVFMPRKDYEALKGLWEKYADTERYEYCRSDKEHYLRSLLTAISDETTTFIKERQQDLDISHGVRLEILPLDGCPSGRFRRRMQIVWALIYSMFNNNEPPTSKGKLMNLVGRFLLFFAPSQKGRCRVWRFAEKRMSRYPIEDCEKITELCARYRYMVNEYPKAVFAKQRWVDFEGRKMPVPDGVETYLAMAFGDYMSLPPKEERVAKHDAVFCDLTHSYREYKGKYYCRKDA